MAITGSTSLVDDSPAVALTTAAGIRRTLVVRNPAAAQTIYLGGSGVTSALGFPLAGGETVTLSLGENDRVWGICATGESTTVRLLEAAGIVLTID
jgi:hypothetical protein